MNNTGSVTVLQKYQRKRLNQRGQTLMYLTFGSIFLLAITVIGTLVGDIAITTNFTQKNLLPHMAHPFGTDWLGRDMLARTLKGMSISIYIGLFASVISTVIAAILGAAAATLGKKVDAVITWFIDLVMGIPHLLLLILISYALGRGTFGVVVAVAISHWPVLTRIIRGEILQLKEANYIKIAGKLGQSKMKIVVKHMIPHVLPQFLVGLVLLFPHAILHEAALTFLGFGLPPEQPGIGIILSESMKYLSLGMWWLALFPGMVLMTAVLLFDLVGGSLRKIIDPHSAQE
ncbi:MULTISPECIES: ABC transporter permease [Pelosinus]|uniref:ABC-type transporter, integral membrane subunit n=1 Tax=Pelosinus fermentans B4 TaxID=1149862 RepID=I9L5Z9_9FIRM|nr:MULTISPECIES: ABC transporter permease [Pelosinus]EIW15661.1 ABC-type transporter, integral membrane subunit [Pelosinus fermentans B4]EIW26649.1 ABC-type transporter, integral membrane subunit [Pelosinus fermentans A11]OAM92406.1 ABC-type transporter, integral membrane subunit [Pelosinus fermentans DSM 17108]SDQ43800.1 peptide/nickel transport system permease protein [Pelosinus fermentans]